MTRTELNDLRYLARNVGAGRWDSGPETGAGHVWIYRDGHCTGEPVFKMRGTEPGFQQSAAERQDQAELISTVLNNLTFLLDAAEARCSR
jgi:hypothetical protein